MTTRELFYRHLAQTSEFPLALEIVRAEGMYMYDASGKAYMDLISGISVSALGHGHPAVVEAVREQAGRYMHLMVYGELVQSPQVELARLLLETLPERLDNVYLVNSGSEAVEGALKLARRHTGRREVVAFKNAYHGSTHGALSLTGDQQLKASFYPLIPGIMHINYNCSADLHAITRATACVVAESIQGEAGAVVPDASFMKALRKRCDETGAMLILDEIQAGMGRTGKPWAFMHFGVEPDILCLAKGLGGGMPIGAFIAAREVMHSLTHKPVLGHITTFGGNAVCAAAAKACLETILEQRLWEQAARHGQSFKAQLKHPLIRSVKGMGLLLALELDSFAICQKLIHRCLDKGLFTDWFLFAGHCLRIAPPLTISDDEVNKACRLILEAADEISP